MASYLVLGKYTIVGLGGLVSDGGTNTEKAARELLASYGGKVTQFAFCDGEHDFVIWCDLPDETAISAMKLAVKAMGHVELNSIRLFDSKTVDGIARIAKQGGAPANPKASKQRQNAKGKATKGKKSSKS